MKMSIFRQRTPRSELDHGACIRGATTEADVDLVGLALDTDKPTLIGLDGQNTIIKTVAEGDDAFTFEDLYDTCLTLGDLRNMKRAGVKSPDEVPSSRFRVALTFRLACDIDVALELTAANHGDVRTQLRDLIDGDAEFRDQLYDALVSGFRTQDGDLIFTIRDTQRIDSDSDGRQWTFSSE